MRRRIVTRLTLATVVATSTIALDLAVATPGQAATCTGGSHCYALDNYGSMVGGYAPTNAQGGDLEVDCLSVGNRNTDFIDWEMWQPTSQNLSGSYWVEEGMTAGTVVDGGTGHTGFEWFWADNRPNGLGYAEHYLGGASTGNYTNVSFYWQGNANWGVYRGGSQVGTSVGTGANGWGGNAGMESTTSAATVQGNLHNYQYEDNHNVWHWVGLDITQPGSGGWARTSGGTGYFAATTGCGAAAKPADYAGAPLAPTAAPAALQAIAKQEAVRNGGAAPAGVKYVTSTRKQAAALMNTQLATDEPVYVMQLSGTFVGDHAHVPQGNPKPTGTSMIVVVSAATGKVVDMAISDHTANLSALGAVSGL